MLTIINIFRTLFRYKNESYESLLNLGGMNTLKHHRYYQTTYTSEKGSFQARKSLYKWRILIGRNSANGGEAEDTQVSDNGLSTIILQETYSVLTYDNSEIGLARLISFLFLSIPNCFMCWFSCTRLVPLPRQGHSRLGEYTKKGI